MLLNFSGTILRLTLQQGCLHSMLQLHQSRAVWEVLVFFSCFESHIFRPYDFLAKYLVREWLPKLPRRPGRFAVFNLFFQKRGQDSDLPNLGGSGLDYTNPTVPSQVHRFHTKPINISTSPMWWFIWTISIQFQLKNFPSSLIHSRI